MPLNNDRVFFFQGVILFSFIALLSLLILFSMPWALDKGERMDTNRRDILEAK